RVAPRAGANRNRRPPLHLAPRQRPARAAAPREAHTRRTAGHGLSAGRGASTGTGAAMSWADRPPSLVPIAALYGPLIVNTTGRGSTRRFYPPYRARTPRELAAAA